MNNDQNSKATPDDQAGNHVIEPDDNIPEVQIEDLPEIMRQAAERAGWTSLMPVQSKTIPYVMDRRDLMVQSHTGSGKTGAFVLPILERLDQSKAACQALVLVPTRELALQVAAEAELLSGKDGLRVIAVYGGVGYGPQIDAFRKGAHLVVGTPGRILDHLIKRSLSLDALDMLIFDEADRMMSMGFYPDMKRVQSFLPSRRINAYMFSATFPPHVLRLASQFLERPETLSLSKEHVHVTQTEHIYYTAPAMDKDRCLVRLIEIENPVASLIFCNTKQKVHYITVVLQRFGYDAEEISSDLSQSQREKVMARIRKGKLRFLVATDVAARGIDLPDLSHVIQYEPPEDPEAYIHRAGRTGRAGASGVAITLVSGMEDIELKRIGKRFNIDLQEREMPSDEDVAEIASQRVTALLEARLRERDNLQVERMQRFVPLAKGLGESDDELALIAMLIDDYYQESLHAVPDRPPAEEPRKKPLRTKSEPRQRKGGNRGGGRSRRPRGKSRGSK